MDFSEGGMTILALDIGGSHVKFRTQRQRTVIKLKSGRHLTPALMMKEIRAVAADWDYDRVSIGYPGPVVHNRPLREPANLGKGWLKFNFQRAFAGKPVRIINDAAMQALGSYEGKRMLFLGLGTGLGSAMIADGAVEAMELAHLPWKKGKTYEDFLGAAALKEAGKKRWSKTVLEAVADLQAAMEADYVVLGGGNAKLIGKLPSGIKLGSNANAFKGGFRLWKHDAT
jgi:polyphosphate glucokinase